jgi:pimeloyl-ACP methyl ester carboxylesterase
MVCVLLKSWMRWLVLECTVYPDLGELMAHLRLDGQQIAYTIHGQGPRTTVLLPGLLLSQKMQAPLARQLAGRGNRVITMDPLGHGESSRPQQVWHYSMSAFAGQTLALLDHLEVDRAIIGGTSLGANITLELTAQAPERVAGMVVEMPVLDHAIAACGAVFTPLLLALRFGAPAMRALAAVAGVVPRSALPFLAEIGLDCVAQDPAASAAVLSGILYGRVAPDHNERCRIQQPALIIGHPRDPIHPFSDAGMLASELPNGRLIDAHSILELRVRPQRLTARIAQFIDECWDDAAAAPATQAAAG